MKERLGQDVRLLAARRGYRSAHGGREERSSQGRGPTGVQLGGSDGACQKVSNGRVGWSGVLASAEVEMRRLG